LVDGLHVRNGEKFPVIEQGFFFTKVTFYFFT